LKKFIKKLIGEQKAKKLKYIGWRNCLKYFLFQRIFRINSHVPWPCHWSSIISSPENIKSASYRPYLGYMPGQYIQAINGIQIGKNLRIAPGVKIISASHNLNNYDIHDKVDPIIIGDNCWLGANSVLLPGVIIGDHTVVAAGAVVSKSFPEGNCVLGGVPAKKLKQLGDYEGQSDW
jgi:acetyltransferase-like isoleucine patch superfamily enzyme